MNKHSTVPTVHVVNDSQWGGLSGLVRSVCRFEGSGYPLCVLDRLHRAICLYGKDELIKEQFSFSFLLDERSYVCVCVCAVHVRACVFMNISPAAADASDEQMDGLAPLESCVRPQKKLTSTAAAAGPLICGNGHQFPESTGPKPPAPRWLLRVSHTSTASLLAITIPAWTHPLPCLHIYAQHHEVADPQMAPFQDRIKARHLLKT